MNALLPMIEKWRKSLDEGGAFGALITDLSKVFDRSPHKLPNFMLIGLISLL